MSLITASAIENLHRAAKAEIKDLKQWRNNYNRDPRDDHWKLFEVEDTNETDGRLLIPAPSLFKSLDITNSPSPTTENGGCLPTIGQCATHLELLEVFFALRYNIINSAALDTTFGVKAKEEIVYRKKFDRPTGRYIYKKTQLRDDTYQNRRREKWDFYLKIAVMRFGTWIRAVSQIVEEQARAKGGVVSLPYLPPLGMSLSSKTTGLDCRAKRISLVRYSHGLARLFAKPH